MCCKNHYEYVCPAAVGWQRGSVISAGEAARWEWHQPATRMSPFRGAGDTRPVYSSADELSPAAGSPQSSVSGQEGGRHELALAGHCPPFPFPFPFPLWVQGAGGREALGSPAMETDCWVRALRGHREQENKHWLLERGKVKRNGQALGWEEEERFERRGKRQEQSRGTGWSVCNSDGCDTQL